jgi:hypothetical protein
MPMFEIPDTVRDGWPSGARDFDFLQGEWVIRHRRLRERLKGSTDWVEFETPFVMQSILGGLGNIDQCRTAGEPFFEGVSLRLFDCADGLWRQQAFSADGGGSWETNWFMYFRRAGTGA